jgi:hypothetical protein
MEDGQETTPRRINTSDDCAHTGMSTPKNGIDAGTQTDESYISSREIIPEIQTPIRELYPSYWPQRYPIGTIIDYDFHFNTDFGIADLVRFYGYQDDWDVWQIDVQGGEPWWATTELVNNINWSNHRFHFPYLDLLGRSGYTYPDRFALLTGNRGEAHQNLHFYSNTTAQLFIQLNRFHAPAVPFYTSAGEPIIPRYRHQDPEALYLGLWHTNALTISEKFYHIRRFWFLLDDSRNEDQIHLWVVVGHPNHRQVNSSRDTRRLDEWDISINKRVHIFLFKLERFKEVAFIHNDLQFDLFRTKFFFESKFLALSVQVPDDTERRFREAWLIADYYNYLHSLLRIRSHQLERYHNIDNCNHMTHTGYRIIELSDFITRTTTVLFALKEELDSYQPLVLPLPPVPGYPTSSIISLPPVPGYSTSSTS